MALSADKAYTELMERERDRSVLESIRSLLDWDEATMMPRGGSDLRGIQKASLAKTGHEKLTDPRIGELLETLEKSSYVESQPSSGNIRAIRRVYDRAVKVPAELVEDRARLSTASTNAWMDARRTKNFALFKPYLEKMVSFCRQEAKAVGFAENPYDALLDNYEPGEKSANLKILFSELKKEIVQLLNKAESSAKKPSADFFQRLYPVAKQTELSKYAMTAFGFRMDDGRLDLSTHPFCQGFWPKDVRLTTRFDENDFSGGLLSTLHETGHGMYEQGLDIAQWGIPGGRYCSMGIHESQSRLWENMVGRNPAFWDFFYPKVQSYFPEALKPTEKDAFVFALNGVEKTFIRTESDEVTYNLHIILRFELEEALLRGEIDAGQIPDAWNAKFKDLFGITPPDDSKGCLQDIHWSTGDLGYFPTYTLGNLYAAQFMEKARGDLGDLNRDFSRGEFHRLREWLAQNIYAVGQTLSASALCEKATGKKLTAGPLIGHLRSKCSYFY